MDATPEEWRPIAGFENFYEVSDCGRVRSLDRIVMRRNGAPKTISGRILTPYPVATKGYQTVSLYDRGRRSPRSIHGLVLEAFVGPRPSGMVGCHNDGDVENNHLGNLRWDSQGENNQDTIRHGRHRNANKTHCIRGHSLNDAYLKQDGGRQCLHCLREARSRRRKVSTWQ